jgi:signal transduction histidine kinase
MKPPDEPHAVSRRFIRRQHPATWRIHAARQLTRSGLSTDRAIIPLADTALLVSRDRDYSLRAKIDADASEIAVSVEPSIPCSLISSNATQRSMRRAVDLSAIALEISAELTRSDPGHRVDFVIHKTPGVLADAGLIRIVLDNLLRNSWKYTSHHPRARIEFGATQRAGGPVFFVRDDGAGFDPSHADRLFQPFQRLDGKGDFP